MERGSTRVEKATRWAGDRFAGIEWHVYRMGHLTDYPIGAVRCDRGTWYALDNNGKRLPAPGCKTRRAAIFTLCKFDDHNALPN